MCMTSDFFLEEADRWRPEAWEIMRSRPDVVFFLLTKRPGRVRECLPPRWGDGWENIFFHVTCENQRRADERIPLLLDLPFKHKGIMCAPLIGPVTIKTYLETGQIEQVICGGENYGGARPCDFDLGKIAAGGVRGPGRYVLLYRNRVGVYQGRAEVRPSRQAGAESDGPQIWNELSGPSHPVPADGCLWERTVSGSAVSAPFQRSLRLLRQPADLQRLF